MRKYNRHSVSQGFTLVELLLVVAILGILSAVVVVSFGGRQLDAMIKATRVSIANIATAVDIYEVDTGQLPPSLNALNQATGEPNWNGPYLKGGLPSDAWGTPFQYTVKSAKSYEVRSAGPDRQIGNEDDITSFAF